MKVHAYPRNPAWPKSWCGARRGRALGRAILEGHPRSIGKVLAQISCDDCRARLVALLAVTT